jgi:hypothetical protein
MLGTDQSLVGVLGFLVSQGEHSTSPLGKFFHAWHKSLLNPWEPQAFLSRTQAGNTRIDSTKQKAGFLYEDD